MTFQALRERKKLTRYRVAAEAGLNYKTIWLIEAGRSKDVRRSTLEKLSKTLGVSVDTVIRSIRQTPEAA